MPHGSLLYIMLRHRSRFERSAMLTYAVFDIGAMVYWVLPTAPPWYAAAHGGRGGDFNGRLLARSTPDGGSRATAVTPSSPYMDRAATWRAAANAGSRDIAVRRMMVEYGEFFWKDGWGPLYSVLGGNPLAAMPSLHFATSMMAAQLLTETGPVAGTLAWGYTATLGFALVYLGEHYVVDLLAGAALTAAVYRIGPRAGPLLERVATTVAALEARAHEAG